MLEPIKLKGNYKHYLWGGTKLSSKYHKKSNHNLIAESWELSTHQDGYSKVINDNDIEDDFTSYLDYLGERALGFKKNDFKDLPILIKLIDAFQPLSIQVHPNDEYAWSHEHDNGKTEMWLILDHDPGAYLYYGVNRKISKSELKERIEKNTILEVLNKVEVHKGDVFFIEAGMIHAIGAGIVLCEIQQKSNITYRLYDYGRKDENGNDRKLHIDQAMEVACLEPKPCYVKAEAILIDTKQLCIRLLRSCKYFQVYEYSVLSHVEFHVSKESFCAIVMCKGNGVLLYDDKKIVIEQGETIFIPAQDHLIQMNGNCTFLIVTL